MKAKTYRGLARKLDSIALGKGFHMDAILQAQRLVKGDEYALLQRYRNGNAQGMDHVALQALAGKLRGGE